MIFKDRKIPRHLIIQEEYEIRKRTGNRPFKAILLLLTILTVTYLVTSGLFYL